MNTAMKLKTSEDIEIATFKFVGILQDAAQVATPKRNSFSPVNNLPSDIKSLVAKKCRARSKWQKTMLQKTDAYLIMQGTN